MKRATAWWSLVVIFATSATLAVRAADWPQWRGLNRAAKVTDFKAPATWPTQLDERWNVAVGEGDSTPSLVGDRLYVFSRQDGNEVLRCLDAHTGKEIWQDKYASEGAEGGARRHSGPRASPTVADGKVVTFGVRGMLSCYDAQSGKVLWRKDELSWPIFFVSSSPIVVDGLCIVQRGDAQAGEIIAFDLDSGDEKWKWTGAAPAYSSPVLMTTDDRKLVVALATGKVVALDAAKGELAWQAEVAGGGFGGRGRGGFGPGGFGPGGRRGPGGAGEPRGTGAGERRGPGGGQDREAGASLLPASGSVFAQPQPDRGRGERGPGRGGFGGRGGRGGGGGMTRFAATPIVDGQTIIYAGAGNALKAVKLEKDGDKIVGKELWTNSETPLSFNTPVLKDGKLYGVTSASQFFCVNADSGQTAWIGPRDTGGGYGSVVDAGSVLLGITPDSGLVVIEPTDKEYKEIARIKLSDSPIYAHLVVSGNRLYVKNQDAVAMFVVE